MKSRKVVLIVMLMLMVVGFKFGYADPSAPPPPPPPPVTTHYYYLADEFTDCGNSNTIRYCNEYYSKTKIVTKSGRVITNEVSNVCGKDPSCANGQPCVIKNPVDDNKWITEELSEDWECPKGKAIAQIHEPGNLDAGFDTISLSNMPPYYENYTADIYFNAFIPACVNRIPMINFNPKLISGSGELTSQKTGLYVRHETLDYELKPTGGVLKNFYYPLQGNYKEFYNLSSSLKSYRMWSFRERFVEGLLRTVESKNLEFPDSVDKDVDSLDPTRAHDFEDIYFSSDFMMGAYSVDNIQNVPVGEEITQHIESTCYINPYDLGINKIDTPNDVKKAIKNSEDKQEIITILNSDDELCDLDSNLFIQDIKYEGETSKNDYDRNNNVIAVDYEDLYDYYNKKNIPLYYRGYNAYNYKQKLEDYGGISIWEINTVTYDLRGIKILSSKEPRQEIRDINSISINTGNKDLELSVNEFTDFDDSDEFKNYVQGIDRYNEKVDFSKELYDNGYLNNELYLVKSFSKIDIVDNDTINIKFDYYTTDMIFNMDIDNINRYDYAKLKLDIIKTTNTDSSWNWRSLQDLTLTKLGKCLYSWDSCLFTPRTESNVDWEMMEVADLGYGPRQGSLAYIWSKQTVESDYDIEYNYHFDGARGENIVNTPITVYRRCEENMSWISDEKYYSCYNGTVYKCFYGVSDDELLLGNVRSIKPGESILIESGRGFICKGSDTGPKFEEVSCYDDLSLYS